TQWFLFYLIPFSIVGIGMFTLAPHYDGLLYLVTVLYAAGTIFLMHQAEWDVFHVIPLLFVYDALWLFDGILLTDYIMLFRLGLFSVLLTILGMAIFPVIYAEKAGRAIAYTTDWYSIFGLVAICNMYAVTETVLWTKLLPGILIALYLLVQRRR